MPDGAVAEADEATFGALVLDVSGPVLVVFSAEWCVPCRLLDPVVAELASAYRGRLRVVRVDTDAHPELASAQGVDSIPCVQVFAAGSLVRTVVGAQPKPELVALVEGILAAG